MCGPVDNYWRQRVAVGHDYMLLEMTAMKQERKPSDPRTPKSWDLRDLGLSAVCVSAKHAALMLGLRAKDARRICYLGQRGQIPRVRVGRAYVYPVAGLKKYVRQNTAMAKS